jgi:hypothetical protein
MNICVLVPNSTIRNSLITKGLQNGFFSPRRDNWDYGSATHNGHTFYFYGKYDIPSIQGMTFDAVHTSLVYFQTKFDPEVQKLINEAKSRVI